MAAYIRAERKKQKSRKRKQEGTGEGESKEERRARKAAKKAKKAEKKARAERARDEEKKPRVVKRQGDGSEDEGDRKPRIRDPSRSRSPGRPIFKRGEPSREDIKPSRADLSRFQERESHDGRRYQGRTRSATPPFTGETIKREERSPRREEKPSRHDRHREEPYPERYDSRDRYRDRSPRRDDRSPRGSHGDPSRRRDDRTSDRGFTSRQHPPARHRTEQDWRSARHEDPPSGAAEGVYASWRGKREVERVMRRVGGEETRAKRW